MAQKSMSVWAVAALLLFAGPGWAQDISVARLSNDIRDLSTDGLMGRQAGGPGEAPTLAFLQARYEALGLSPGGRDGQWLQPVDLYRFVPARPSVASWTAADGQRRPLDPAVDVLLRAGNDSGEARIVDAAVVFVGYGIHAPERDWSDYGDVDVRGKVVIIMAGEPDGDRFNGAVPTLYASTGYKLAEASKRGAVAVLTLVMAPRTDRGWLGAGRTGAGARTRIPGLDTVDANGAINRDTATAWAQAGGLSVASLARFGDGNFKAVELRGVQLSLDIAETREVVRTHNLLARLEGTERADQTVIYSAHWDHLGVAAPDAQGDTVFNGAWDNASGTAGVLELARLIAGGRRPERSVVFLHTTAEEMGLLGAQAYGLDPVYPLATTVADLNIDMLPMGPPTRDLPITGHGQNTLEDDLQVLAAEQGRTVVDDGQPERNLYFRSDHFAFARAGVPALMTWHGVDRLDGGREAGLAAYQSGFQTIYHQRDDEWRADMDWSGAVEDLRLLYRLGLTLADSEAWPGWKTGSEFRAIREASDGERTSAIPAP